MISESEVWSHLNIRQGITAIIGGGGKTTLMSILAAYFAAHASVIVSTSTHIFRPDSIPFSETVPDKLASGQCIAVGNPCDHGKLSSPVQSFSELRMFADYLFVEADGSKGLPIKVHLEYEPVIPEDSGSVIAVLGMDGIGKTIKECVHRSAACAHRFHVSEDSLVTPALAACILRSYPSVTGVVLNKADDPVSVSKAEQIASLLPYPSVITSFVSKDSFLELWRDGKCLL